MCCRICHRIAAKTTPGSRSPVAISSGLRKRKAAKNSSRLKASATQHPADHGDRSGGLRGHVARGDGRDDQQQPEHGDQAEAAQPPGQEVGAALARDVPDLLEGVLRRADDAEAAQQQADDADRQRAGAALQRVDVALQLIADDRELAERRVQDFGLVLRVAFEHEAEHGHEQQQQREQRGEAVVGDQRRELPGAVVAELLDHRRGKAQPRAALLDAVERLEAVVEAHRRRPAWSRSPPGRALAPATAARANWQGGLRAERSTWCVSTRCAPQMRAGAPPAGRGSPDQVGDGARGAGQARGAAARAPPSPAQGGPRGLLQPGDARAARAGACAARPAVAVVVAAAARG